MGTDMNGTNGGTEMSERAQAGERPLDQPEPIDIGDLIAFRKAPIEDVDALLRWLREIRAEWSEFRLNVRLTDRGLEVVVAGLPDPEAGEQ